MSQPIIRTPDKGCFEVYESTWGSYLRPVFDPLADAEVTEVHLDTFELNKEIHRIPANLWQAWVQLCFHFVDKVKSDLEVSVRILRSEEDPSHYRILVPKQEVTSVSVRAKDFNQSVDIINGEEIESYPPSGWIPVGSSHSHNTMDSFFSSTDDNYELKDPGIHLVIGKINIKTRTYTIAASVVGSGRRFLVDYDKLVDSTPVDKVTFHQKVLDYVKVEGPKLNTSYTTKTSSIYQQWHKNNFNKTTSKKEFEESIDYSDPFFFQDGYFDRDNEFWESELSELNTVDTWNVKDSIQDYFIDNFFDDECEDSVASFIGMMTPIIKYLKQNSQSPYKIKNFANFLDGEMRQLESWTSKKKLNYI